MPKTIQNLDGSEQIRFDLEATVEENFNLYQDSLAKFPASFQFLKLRFDQYLKSVPLHKREQAGEEDTEIAFNVVK